VLNWCVVLRNLALCAVNLLCRFVAVDFGYVVLSGD
jgi:hypothetical protein